MIEKYKIIELENNLKYIIIDYTIYNDNRYLLLEKISDDEESLEDELGIFKEIVNEKESFIEKVNDSELIDKLKFIFGDYYNYDNLNN